MHDQGINKEEVFVAPITLLNTETCTIVASVIARVGGRSTCSPPFWAPGIDEHRKRDDEEWRFCLTSRLGISLIQAPLLSTRGQTLDAVSPSTIDLRLGRTFVRPVRVGGSAVEHHIDTRDSAAVQEAIADLSEPITIPEGKFFTIGRGEFVLAQTLERIELPNHIGARIEGRSTLARLGLSVHQTAPIVHPTYRGVLTLELLNIGPFTLKLYPNQTVCQLLLEEMSQPAGPRT